ncbi:MAG: sel1 repeat family protein, partial [Rhodospirillaceae bacterium]|nr:sel1 repeat family protein [Rhodospirillaceae bacterium]
MMSSVALADYAAGLTAFNRKDFAHAFSEWIESAKAGDAHAQHGLGMLYEMGQGVPYADPKAASEWYQKAATQNYAPAINNLARLYADGRGVKQDVPKAIELWSKAAEAGNTTARFNLGLQYAAGVGVKKDMKKAAEYLLQAAESGLPEAQFAVAGYYRDGTGVPKDMDAARQWYDRAASAGFEPARKELAAIDDQMHMYQDHRSLVLAESGVMQLRGRFRLARRVLAIAAVRDPASVGTGYALALP